MSTTMERVSEFEIELEQAGGPEQDEILSDIKEIVHGGSDRGINNPNGFVGVNFAINTFLTERIEETVQLKGRLQCCLPHRARSCISGGG